MDDRPSRLSLAFGSVSFLLSFASAVFLIAEGRFLFPVPVPVASFALITLAGSFALAVAGMFTGVIGLLLRQGRHAALGLGLSLLALAPLAAYGATVLAAFETID